jgi:hypothetical protein
MRNYMGMNQAIINEPLDPTLDFHNYMGTVNYKFHCDCWEDEKYTMPYNDNQAKATTSKMEKDQIYDDWYEVLRTLPAVV